MVRGEKKEVTRCSSLPNPGRFLGVMLVCMVMTFSRAQVERVEPPHWWVGFKDTRLQLLINGTEIGNYKASVQDEKVQLMAVHTADSPNYLFLDLNIPEGMPAGKFTILLEGPEGAETTIQYELKERPKEAAAYIGFSSKDVIYLITPDRFANGDPTNDIRDFLKEKKIDRKDDYARHGGDIQGMIDHLDYIEDMGFTALWPSPLLINDMPRESYHGYAITDYYEVDPRFGSLEDYKKLASETGKRGIKLIMDQVNNHCGLGHWWMEDLPFKDWILFCFDRYTTG